MNYFAHAYPFLEDPYFVAGTGVPDWLSVVDRKVRVRRPTVEAKAGQDHPPTMAVGRGILQHLRDDARFHETRAFAELSLRLTVAARDATGPDPGMRPSFLGHLLVELLLDASLVAEHPAALDRYYELLGAVDPEVVQAAVNRVANRPTDRLAVMIGRFCQARILWDYLEDAKLMVRLNQVMRRVGFEPLPATFGEILPQARALVSDRRAELLTGIPALE